MAWYKRNTGRDIDDCGNCIYLEADSQHEYCTYCAELLENCDRICHVKRVL